MKHKTEEKNRPRLSLILCTRNDQYMGDSIYRLQITLNYTAIQVKELNRMADVEIVICDWGSKAPLHKALHLNEYAAQLVSFVYVPPDVAKPLQKDSPFPEVLALNAAARRCRGDYIGRIDQDTLVGKHFLKTFFDLAEGKLPLTVPAEKALLFAVRKGIPYRFAVKCPPLEQVDRYIEMFKRFFVIEQNFKTEPYIYLAAVGIWMVHRDIWFECHGYDEQLIYMNEMEPNMVTRLMTKYKLVDLGKLVDYDFYHLDHYHSLGTNMSSQFRKTNDSKREKLLAANDADWGLNKYPVEIYPYLPESGEDNHRAAYTSGFGGLVFITSLQIAGEHIYRFFRAIWRKIVAVTELFMRPWRRRARTVKNTVKGHPITSWPVLLTRLVQNHLAGIDEEAANKK